MSRHHIQIVRVENGWIATKNGSLFEHSLADKDPKPIWVFSGLRPLMTFLREHGIRPHINVPKQAPDKTIVPFPAPTAP
jgi:hypothetical protein